MKKVLLASTALVAFAGAAVADDNPNISISGSAEMGIRGANATLDFGGPGGGEIDSTLPAQFHTDIDVTFSMSGETDGGLSFGASIDLDESGDGSAAVDNDFDDGGIAIFISGNFGTVTMGDTDGALDRVMTDAGNISNPGSIADDETVHVGYLGSWLDGFGDGQIVRYDYTFDAFEFAVSVEQHDDILGAGVVDEDDDTMTWSIGFGYEFEFAGGSVDLGLGYQDYSNDGNGPNFEIIDDLGGVFTIGGGEDISAVGLGATVNLDSGISVGFTYTSFDFEEDDSDMTHIAIGAGYSFDAFSVHFNYGQFDGESAGDDFTARGFGLSAAYDLGGGASVLFGYGNSQVDDIDFNADGNDDEYSANTYSLGLSFSF